MPIEDCLIFIEFDQYQAGYLLKEVLTLTSSFQLPGHLADWISSQHKVTPAPKG